MSRARVGRFLLAALLALAVAACEPHGPGSFTATVQAPAPLGGVLLEITGEGIVGFEGVGDARTIAATAAAAGPTKRLVVVSPTGALSFQVKVEDVSLPNPTGAIVSAVSLTNQPVTALEGYTLRISR